MKIKIKPRNLKDFKDDYGVLKFHLYNATKYFGSLLLSQKVFQDMIVNIKVCWKIDADDDDFYYGDCINTDLDRYPREFSIRLLASKTKAQRRNMFETLAHEMVHLRQYATGQLKQLERENNVYRFGKLYYNSKNIVYQNLPWEVEAETLEVVLTKAFAINYKLIDYLGYKL